MSLFSAIRMGGNALQADQIALQVIGQNIANANTPGYIREEVVFATAPAQKLGNLILGLGVEVKAVVQVLDTFVEGRLRSSVSERASAETQERSYAELESVIGELNTTDLSTTLNNFFSSISEILNQPESISTRNLAMLQGKTLAQQINGMAQRVTQMRVDVNNRILSMGGDINRLIEEIRVLNLRIAEMEGGNVSRSDAVGLRDQRLEALEKLASLIDIRVEEQPSGTVSVYAGGSFLVIDANSRPVEVVSRTEEGIQKADIQIAEIATPLNPASGELRGLLSARDEILGGFLGKLNDLAATLALEFNKVFSSGQGLTGYQEVTSEFAVSSPDAPLNQAGLFFTPVNGAFQIQVYEKKTGLTHTYDIQVKLTGLGEDTTLADLAAQINGIPSLSASVSAAISDTGRLKIASLAADQSFAFANDTSGVLAALGINTFFSGTSAQDLDVNAVIQRDPGKFAASRGGIGGDTVNAVDLAAFLDRPLESRGGDTLAVLYDRMVGQTTQGSAVARANAEGLRVFEQTLRNQKTAISGVNLDEEAIRMIAYQRAFQATARFIKTVSDMLELLANL